LQNGGCGSYDGLGMARGILGVVREMRRGGGGEVKEFFLL